MNKPLDVCTVAATIRDFPINHPDFERDAFTGEVTGLEPRQWNGQQSEPRPEVGVVQAELGQDGKPNYNNGSENQRLTTTGEDNFNQWFGRSPGNYKEVLYPLDFVYDNGQYKFEAKPFYPLDRYLTSDDTFGSFYSQMFNPDGSLTAMGAEVIDRNMKDHGANQAFLTHPDGTPLTREELLRIYSEWNRDGNGELKTKLHNYGFTLEAETAFTYRGDEFFRFEGDDDLWIFIDNLLVIDLGGLHRTTGRTLDLQLADGQDTLVRNLRHDLGIVQADDRLNLMLKKGMTYNLKIFYAERHTFDSTCCFYTSLYLTSQALESERPTSQTLESEQLAAQSQQSELESVISPFSEAALELEQPVAQSQQLEPEPVSASFSTEAFELEQPVAQSRQAELESVGASFSEAALESEQPVAQSQQSEPEPVASPFPEELIGQSRARCEVRIDAVQDAIEPSDPMPGLPGKFRIRISEPAPAGGVRVKYEIVQDSRNATPNADYTLSPVQEVLIPEGHQTAEVLVTPKGDRTRDGSESVSLRVIEEAQGSYAATKAQDTIHIRDVFSFGTAERTVCVAPIRTIIRREEEITIVRRVRKVEDVDVSATCPINTTQV